MYLGELSKGVAYMAEVQVKADDKSECLSDIMNIINGN